MGEFSDGELLLLLAPVVLLDLGLRVFALVHLARQAHTNGPKWVWATVIVVVSFFGWAAYFLVGRREE